ncbi:MAG: hypothetical protein AB9836_06050 [Aminipila sp.]
MRTIEEIKEEYKHHLELAVETGKEKKARELRKEIANALTVGIPINCLEIICNAQRENRLVILPDGLEEAQYESLKKSINEMLQPILNRAGIREADSE